MAFYQHIAKQKIEAPLEKVWDFMRSPDNLKEITPDHMGFEVTSKAPHDKMYPGLIISYKVSPLLGIRMTWVTEITQVRDKYYFVDEQRIGPYKMWHHQHIIEPDGEGTLMTDIVSYSPPFGILGALMNTLFIRKQLNAIFAYRTKAVKRILG